MTNEEDCLIAGGASAYCVVVNDDGGALSVETDDGPVPLDDATAEMIACDCGCIEPALNDEEADRRVPVALRRRVLARDGCRCRNCGSSHRKQMHHIVHFSQGGLTTYENLITLCRTCHSLIHAELLRIQGNAQIGWRFVDGEGRDLHGPGLSPAQAIGELVREGQALVVRAPAAQGPAAAQEIVRLADVPGEIDGEWWRRHRHLLTFNDTNATFEMRAGLPALTAEAYPGVGTMCQLRPDLTLAELVGQETVVRSLADAVGVALEHDEPLGHVLLYGAPGLGKTTLAQAIAGELGTAVHSATATLLRNPLAMVRVLASLGRHDVLFLDEIHALPARVTELFHEALTHRRLRIPVHCGAVARTLLLRLPPFTLVGATTNRGELPPAFLSRFEHVKRSSLMLRVLRRGERGPGIVPGPRATAREGMQIDDDAAARLASVGRGTPREALRLLRLAWGEARRARRGLIDAAIVEVTLANLEIDEQGLDAVDREYLEVLRSRGPGRPLGLARVAAIMGESARALECLHEPYIFRLGLAETTPLGRVALQARAS